MIPGLIAAVLILALAVLVWQELRYRRIRRTRAQDFQPSFQLNDAFHVIVFFKLSRGDKLLETVRSFVTQITSISGARLIYAGQAAFTVNSEQLPDYDWDGVVMLEFPSRADYKQCCDDYRYNAARGLFADSYYHAMRRNRRICAALPRLLLRVRLKDILSGKWRLPPFEMSQEFNTFPEFQKWRDRVHRLAALHEVNRTGLVVFNLVKFPTVGGQDSAEAMGGEMLSRMAALGYGPLHLGRTVALEQLARFDRAYVIFYPSARYYADMLSSQFFAGITSEKRLGDAIRVPTVPVTARI